RVSGFPAESRCPSSHLIRLIQTRICLRESDHSKHLGTRFREGDRRIDLGAIDDLRQAARWLEDDAAPPPPGVLDCKGAQVTNAAVVSKDDGGEHSRDTCCRSPVWWQLPYCRVPPNREYPQTRGHLLQTEDAVVQSWLKHCPRCGPWSTKAFSPAFLTDPRPQSR